MFHTLVEEAAYATALDGFSVHDREGETVVIFHELTNPDAAVVADAMIRADSVSHALA